jgi:hypothetical protein
MKNDLTVRHALDIASGIGLKKLKFTRLHLASKLFTLYFVAKKHILATIFKGGFPYT